MKPDVVDVAVIAYDMIQSLIIEKNFVDVSCIQVRY